MSLMALMGGGLSKPKDEDEEGGEPSSDSDDDQDLAELGAKYMQSMYDAMKSGEWEAAFKAHCRLAELHSYMEDQERGY